MPDKRKTPQLFDPNKAHGRDLFQTPRYATELLIPFFPDSDDLVIWECAAGGGAISSVLIEYGFRVMASDIRDRTSINFLTYQGELIDSCSIIVTNPPFSCKSQFYAKCIQIGKPFALLVPADYSGWLIDAVRYNGCKKIIPTRRIDYITPSGKDANGGHTSNFHSLWLTKDLQYSMDDLDSTEIFVDLSLEDKKRIY